jgi:hypothetical protein
MRKTKKTKETARKFLPPRGQGEGKLSGSSGKFLSEEERTAIMEA